MIFYYISMRKTETHKNKLKKILDTIKKKLTLLARIIFLEQLSKELAIKLVWPNRICQRTVTFLEFHFLIFISRTLYCNSIHGRCSLPYYIFNYFFIALGTCKNIIFNTITKVYPVSFYKLSDHSNSYTIKDILPYLKKRMKKLDCKHF